MSKKKIDPRVIGNIRKAVWAAFQTISYVQTSTSTTGRSPNKIYSITRGTDVRGKTCPSGSSSIQILLSTSYASSTPFSPQPPRSLIPDVPPNLALALAFRPPNSLYISRISTLDGRDAASASCFHFSSRISRGVCWPDRNGVRYPERGDWGGDRAGTAFR